MRSDTCDDFQEKTCKFANGCALNRFLQMRPLKASSIVHIFAVIHVMASLSCRLCGIDDSLLLTLLTMTMTVLVCFKRGVSVEFTAASVVIVNIAGYLIGIGGAWLINRISGSELLVHSISTLLTTELLGWGTIGTGRLFKIDGRTRDWTPRLKWLLSAVAVIFILRLVYTELFSSKYFSAESSYRIISMLLSNTVAILLLICLNIIYIRAMRKRFRIRNTLLKYAIFIVFILSTSALTAVIAGFQLPFNLNTTFTTKEFSLLFTVALIAEIVFYCLIYMVDYAISTRREMQKERWNARQAQFKYLKLKQQVNPHFLFNSLNILDCLVCDHQDEQASSYIHKLAGMYRYMLQNDSDSLVTLKDEMQFAMMYADLMKVRFQEGITLQVDIPESLMERGVVPCAVQMLIENAIKHNVATRSSVLHINIMADESGVTVSNNLNPKISSSPSTGIGLANIRQQYLDLTGRQIEIRKTQDTYTVKLPLTYNTGTILQPRLS